MSPWASVPASRQKPCRSPASPALLVAVWHLLCPVGCSSQRFGNGLLLGIYEQSESALSARGTATPLQAPPRQQEQLLLIARRLGEVLNGA